MKNLSYETWVAQFVARLADHFNLNGWTVSIAYEDEPDGSTYAEIAVNSVYQFADLTIYPQAKLDFESGEHDRLTMSLVHELVHIFFDPFQEAMTDFLSVTTTPAFMATVENQTQKLTAVILKSLPENIIPPFPTRRKQK